MINYVNQVLDFPDKVNGMLPRNNWNEVISSSEDSAKAWLGFVYKVVAHWGSSALSGIKRASFGALFLCLTYV